MYNVYTLRAAAREPNGFPGTAPTCPYKKYPDIAAVISSGILQGLPDAVSINASFVSPIFISSSASL